MNPTHLNRRQALGALGAVSLSGLLAACGSGDETPGSAEVRASSRLTPEQFDPAATCSVATELTEGPYYFDVDAIRADLREDRVGTLLRLGVRVRDAGTCEPIENAIVDVWHCDALGSYSGFESASSGGGTDGGGPGGPRGSGRSDDKTYLRGAQATSGDGIVEFRTIYPGWYRGRTTHIHAKVHLDRSTLLTTQFFTTRAMDDVVHTRRPYREDPGRDTFNEGDGIYARQGELTLTQDGEDVIGLITLDVTRA